MYLPQKKSSSLKLLNSKLVFSICLLILGVVIFSLAKIIYHRIQIKKEVHSLDQKIKLLEKSNSELTHLIDYLNTESYEERAGRIELGLKKPGEKVIVILEQSTNQATLENSSSTSPPYLSNPQKWWAYFFK